MKQNSSILWLPSIFRAKHQTPWLRKAKDFVWPRALCFLFSFFLFYFETPKESLASSTAQPTQVLQKNWVTGQEKTELNFDTWWIQRAIFTPPAVNVTSVTATSTGSFVVFTGTLQEEQNKLDLPNPHPTRLLTLSTPKYRQHPSEPSKTGLPIHAINPDWLLIHISFIWFISQNVCRVGQGSTRGQ